MNQDAFRQLLASSRQSQLNGQQASVKPQKTTTSIGPAFRPRKVKKTEDKYRDRAAERREGTGNDYADVEAVLEDFEKRVAHEDRDVIEQQRKYLGGDSHHTILVKGLDMSLLEQNRARTVTATEDDEILEQAFTEAISTPEPTEPRKRTREDLIRNLKAKRQNGDGLVVEKSAEDVLDATKTGKFKPIGQTEARPKKRKTAREGKEGKKKKKQKIESVSEPAAGRASGTNVILTDEVPAVTQECDTTEPSSSKVPQTPLEPEPRSLDEDFDIFAGAGDYEGFSGDELSEEEQSDTKEMKAVFITQEAITPIIGTKGWFGEPEPEVRQASNSPEKSPPIPETEEEPQEIRLRPLESSALPSIREFLAMDEAVEKAEKRKARKEKKKKKKAGDDDDD